MTSTELALKKEVSELANAAEGREPIALATLVSSFALAIEHAIEAKTGDALSSAQSYGHGALNRPHPLCRPNALSPWT
jgi:hypothetical protein